MRAFLKRKSDAVLGVVFLVFCFVMSLEIQKIKTPESRIMPFFALGVIALPSLWLIFKAVVLDRSSQATLLHHRRELLVWGMFAALILGVEHLGFYPAAFLFLLGCFLFLRGKADRRTLLQGLVYSVALTLILFLCFTVVVRMPLPVGTLF